jgi:hypothetical protein
MTLRNVLFLDLGYFSLPRAKNKLLKVSNLVCQPYLRIFPLKLPLGQFPPKIPGPVNFCSIEELMSLPGVGAKEADTILEMREAKGDLELEDLSHVPYLRLTPQLIKCLDFTPFEEGEGLEERSVCPSL